MLYFICFRAALYEQIQQNNETYAYSCIAVLAATMELDEETHFYWWLPIAG